MVNKVIWEVQLKKCETKWPFRATVPDHESLGMRLMGNGLFEMRYSKVVFESEQPSNSLITVNSCKHEY